MRLRPNGKSMRARVCAWAVAAMAAAILGLNGVSLCAGQSPASPTPTTAQTPAEPSQTTTSPAQTSTKSAQTSAKQAQSAPAQAPAAAPVQTDKQSTPAAAAPAQANVSTAPSATPQAATTAGDAQNEPVADETAELLKMATDLQAEINRTRVATLSLAVVRKASAIEDLAKKMRSQP